VATLGSTATISAAVAAIRGITAGRRPTSRSASAVIAITALRVAAGPAPATAT